MSTLAAPGCEALPSHSADEPGAAAERLLIGVYLAAPDRPLPSGAPEPEMFRSRLLGAAWAVILALRDQGEPADLINVGKQLRHLGKAPLFAAAGGVDTFLVGLAAQVTAAELHCVGSASATVRDAFTLGQIRARWEAAAPVLAESPQQSAATLRRLADEAAQLAPPSHRFRPLVEKVRAIWSEPAPQMIPTGLAPLDRALGGGLLPCGLSVLVAGTGRGKTGLAIQIALAWLGQGRSVLYLATEMDERQMLSRILAQVRGLPWLTVYQQGPEYLAELAECARDSLANLRCELLKSGEPLAVLLADWRRDQHGQPLAIILDHLTDAARSQGSADMRHATQAVTAELKSFARLHGVPILAVAQTARAVTQPERGGQPKRSGRSFEGSAKDAGEVEADAEALMYLDSDPCPQGGSAPARLHIAKSRGSACDQTVPLRFHGALGLFGEAEESSLPESDTKRVLSAIAERRARQQPTSLRALKSGLRIGQPKLQRLLSMLEQQQQIVSGPDGWRLVSDGSRG